MAFSLLGGSSSGSSWTEDNTASGASPSILLEDTTASAKDGLLLVDGDKMQIRDNAQADGTLLVLDLANNRLGVGVAAPTTALDVSGTATATAFVGPLTGDVTGNVSGSAGSVAAANLTGNTLAAGVTASSLTSVGTLANLTVSGGINTGTLGATGNVTLTGAAPSIILSDTTASAKDLSIQVDSNKAQFRETAAADGSLLVLDLANNYLGVGTNSPGSLLDVNGITRTEGLYSLLAVSDVPALGVLSGHLALLEPALGYGLTAGVNASGNTWLQAHRTNGTPDAFSIALQPSGGGVVIGGAGTGAAGATLDVRGSAIFNESGSDVDFRVEGDTDANLLFVDASTDRVGIGTSSPGVKFAVNGALTATTLNKWTLTAPTTAATLTAGGDSLTYTLPIVTCKIPSEHIQQNSKSAAYTTVLADAGCHILHPSSDNNARTFTIDSNANVAYPIGTAITFVNMINTVTIAITSDTMTLMGAGSTGSRTLAANGIATALKIDTTSWVISGNGLT